ncbi:poly-gamma-glutamate synthase PgsB [Glycomyces buryatensis]|uniref:Poly-gamma-glutamate synthase PgsB n=1 Tax=Glycomyces buryatensis TaxID=2570927 RepID=A0A4S8QLF0_9ACTN|nr:poly-gamma-glutamate synthase PgsB [Glycomyces buryatensis]THV41554.1 poly-gamma-glutamate synthase PgsB [Glycomyces buryatensis]
MLFLYCCVSLSCLALAAAGAIEQRRHYRHLRSIPHRVLVNGIRGKSSITRLCAGALRGGGMVTVAKTTGTAARFIHPDATEEPIRRKFGIANVIEQLGVVRRAAALGPDALVMECMAILPANQEINQTKLIQSTIGVLCNVREDHLEEMGPTLDDVARSLSRSMPVGGICVTAERERLHLLRHEARRRQCRLRLVDPESVTDAEMSKFDYITFKENVAIALAVAGLLGIDRRDALEGMWAAPPDPGVLRVETYRPAGKTIRFANVFAANDPESTLMNIRQLLEQEAIERPLYMVVNCRPDRMERNGQMGALVPLVAPEKVILIGGPTRSAKVAVPPRWQDTVIDHGDLNAGPGLLEAVMADIPSGASIAAVGNIHGHGEALIEQLSHHPAGADGARPFPGVGDLPLPVTANGFQPLTEFQAGPR